MVRWRHVTEARAGTRVTKISERTRPVIPRP
jgi:hypothetical protein